jgi:hypothetical protein
MSNGSIPATILTGFGSGRFARMSLHRNPSSAQRSRSIKV